MTIGDARPTERARRLARLEAENARLRRLAAGQTADIGELETTRGLRRRDGAVDPAHRLLVVSGASNRD